MNVRIFLNTLRLLLTQGFHMVINTFFMFVLQQELLNLLAILNFSLMRTLEILALVCLVLYLYYSYTKSITRTLPCCNNEAN